MRRYNEIMWMSGGLILFCWGVCFLYSQQGVNPAILPDEKDAQDKNRLSGVQMLSGDKFMNYLFPLLASRSVDKIIELFSMLPANEVFAQVEKVIEDQNHALEREDELQLIAALAYRFAQNSVLQQKIFGLFLKDKIYYKNRKNEEPFAYVIAHFGYTSILPALSQWVAEQSRQEKDPKKSARHLVGNFINRTLCYAAKKDESTMLQSFREAGIAITRDQASRLLLTMAKNPKVSGQSVGLLKELGADFRATDRKKMTALLYAVRNENIQLAESLLKAGADPHFMSDPSVGTALQLAQLKGYVALENLLHRYGAKD